MKTKDILRIIYNNTEDHAYNLSKSAGARITPGLNDHISTRVSYLKEDVDTITFTLKAHCLLIGLTSDVDEKDSWDITYNKNTGKVTSR